MNCENSNTIVHFVCPACSTLMFLVLVCLFVEKCHLIDCFESGFTLHPAVFQLHTHVTPVNRDSKNVMECRGILENVEHAQHGSFYIKLQIVDKSYSM